MSPLLFKLTELTIISTLPPGSSDTVVKDCSLLDLSLSVHPSRSKFLSEMFKRVSFSGSPFGGEASRLWITTSGSSYWLLTVGVTVSVGIAVEYFYSIFSEQKTGWLEVLEFSGFLVGFLRVKLAIEKV